MSLINIQNLGLSIGARDVFRGLSASLANGAKVGLIGANGVGKTSLLRIIAGSGVASAGSVHVAQGTRLGYLRQEAVETFAGREHSVFDEMLTAFASVHDQVARLQEMEARMAAGDASDELLAAYGAAQDALAHAGGYDYEVRIEQVLEGLGFNRSLWATPLVHLSGGQKTRALLARLLLERPTMLILDEPTNHLDVDAVEWLETTLRLWEGALLIVSHDRYFLDRVVTDIWEMTPTQIETYRGGYSAYLTQRTERWERRQQLFKDEIERLESEMEIIRRYIAWRKFEEAKGKLKRLSRQLVAIEELGLLNTLGKTWSETGVGGVHVMSVDEAHYRLKAIKPPEWHPPQLHVRLKQAARGGDIVLRTTGLQVGYDGVALFTSDDLHLERGERVGLIGPNGSGKSTFLKTLRGEIPPVAGQIRLGGGLCIGYFAQAHDTLDPGLSVVDTLLAHREMPPGEARDYLAQYLFRGDDVWKPVSALSGGERGRLALAVLALDGVNVLLLDEPTNHLDIPAQEVLQAALEGFTGTVLLVSHDRYLVDQLATQVWELRDGRLRATRGNYQEFLAMREREAVLARGMRQTARAASGARAPQVQETENRQRLKTLTALEDQIAAAEATVANFTQQLEESSESGDIPGLVRLTELYADAQYCLDRLMDQWTELASLSP